MNKDDGQENKSVRKGRKAPIKRLKIADENGQETGQSLRSRKKGNETRNEIATLSEPLVIDQDYERVDMLTNQQLTACKRNAQYRHETLTLNPRDVYALAKIHCTADEICSLLNCSYGTLSAKYAYELQLGYNQGAMSLRRKMHQIAEAGSVPMLIWLSKQRLGYRDHYPDQHGTVNYNIQINELPS